MATQGVLVSIQKILDDLLQQTASCRTTVRLDALGFHCDDVAAESRRSDKVRSLKGETSLDQRGAAAVKWLNSNRRTFVMNDTLDPWDAAVAPEPEVIETYGIRSEMVGPVVVDDSLVGWISVHETRGPRQWTDDEVSALERSCAEMADILRQA